MTTIEHTNSPGRGEPTPEQYKRAGELAYQALARLAQEDALDAVSRTA